MTENEEQVFLLEGEQHISYWWKNVEGGPIHEDDPEELHSLAEMRINESRSKGFESGELVEEIQSTDGKETRYYRGWWNFTDRPLLDQRELGTILAALRLRQELVLAEGIEPDSIQEEIATDGGSFTALSAEEIDALCERING